jgi:predicted RNA-binding Zn-ribbon protein involved in translation (DUF1610 family)
MTKHIVKCPQRKSGSDSCFHIVVQGRYLPQYWLHLEAKPVARLCDLDGFLRDIWLECCGHMSSFEIEGQEYMSSPTDYSDAESMKVPLGKVLSPGLKFRHTYDFGTSTELDLRVAGKFLGVSGKEKIRLLARNLAVSFECSECGKAAVQLCSECSCGSDAWLCDACGSQHQCGEEMLLPIVNSPRIGQCGYTG